MDPNEVKRRGKITTKYVSKDWSRVSDTAGPGLEAVDTRTEILADGRIRRVVVDKEGNVISQIGDPLGYDDDQREIWKEQQQQIARQTPTATSQATAQRDTIDRAGHTWQYNTETKTYDIDLGPKDDPETVKRRQAAEDRAQTREDRLASTAEENAALARSRDERAGRTEERQTAVAERQAASSEDASKRGWAELALQQQREQRLSEVDAAKLRNGEVVRTSEGRFIQIRNDPSGKAIVEDVTPAQTRTGTAPTLPSGTHLGTISTAGQAVAQRIVDDPNMTPQEKERALDTLKGFLTTFTQETTGILGAQQNIYTNEVNQRNVNVRDAESRRNFGAGLVQDSFKEVAGLHVPVGSNLGGPAFLGRVVLGLTLADKLGGLKTIPDVEMGTALQQTKGLGLPGMEQPQQAPQMQQQPQAGGGQPINITFNGGVPSVPQSVQQAIPPNPMAQSLPGGGYLPMDNSLSFDQGQLKAPGYRADVDRPAWMDEMAGVLN